jgi:glycosyltransferase involved in cell wall biosynthesis
MRLLFLAPCIPKVNGVGWEQRAFQFLKGYSQVAKIDLICANFGHTELNPEEQHNLNKLCRIVKIFEVEQVLANTNILHRVQRIFTTYPFFSTVTLDLKFRDILKEYTATADFIHASRLETFAFLPKSAWSKTLLDLDECHVTTWRRKQSIKPADTLKQRLQNFIRYFDTIRIANYQKQTVKQAAAAFVCSEVERNRVNFSQLQVIPNVAKKLPDFPTVVDSQKKRLLFVGNLSTPPNIDAVFYFVNNVWEKILEHCPISQLVIVGRDPCDEILALGGSKRIEVHANITNLDEVYKNATVALVPLRFGAGTKLKLLEAFGYGVPVVSTSIGCEGLPVKDRTHLLIADSADTFAEACIHLLSEPEVRYQLALTAWEFTRTNFDETAVLQRITQTLIQVSST